MEDIPLRTANPAKTAAGAYPLRWDGDYTNLITITNTSQKQLTAHSLITVGTITYTLPEHVIEPGRTAVYDVDKMRQAGEKDVNGKVLPLDARFGKFMWFDSSLGSSAGLMGRNSVTSRTNHRKSSFSCGMACDFTYEKFPAFLTDPFAFASFGWSGSIADVTYTPTGQTYTVPFAFSSTGLTSTNSDILRYAVDPNLSTSYTAAVGLPGTVTASYFLTEMVASTDIFGDCVADQYDSTPSSNMTMGDNTPIITGIYPSDWPAGATTPNVTFTGQYFGTNTPTLSFSPGAGISYTLLSSSDSQIVANVTVATGTPDEDVSVSVTSNGYNGSGFVTGAGGGSPTSRPVYASVRAPRNSPEVTIIGWVNGGADDLANLGGNPNYTLVDHLNSSGTSCAVEVALWSVFLVANDISSQDDRDYANAWLVKHSANGEPPATIDPVNSRIVRDYRLFGNWGGNSGGSFDVGVTPDPCNFLGASIAGYAGAAQASENMGKTGTSSSGQTYRITEGRIGKLGQRGSQTINQGRTVPWIYGVIEFDAFGNPTTSDHSTFPTFYVYINGVLQPGLTSRQSTVKDFINGFDSSNEYSWLPVP